MQQLYYEQKVRDLEKKVGQIDDVLSLIINLIQKFEGGDELFKAIAEIRAENRK